MKTILHLMKTNQQGVFFARKTGCVSAYSACMGGKRSFCKHSR